MESNPPNWLINKIIVSPWSTDTYNKLYCHFCTYIREAGLNYGSYRVIIPKEKEDGKEKVFWHLTSRDEYTWNPKKRRKIKERLPDLERSSRLSWINPIISNCTSPEILAWDYLEGDRQIKTYLWLKNYNFIVIFKKFPDGNRLLITSFYIDIQHKRDELERKYNERIQ